MIETRAFGGLELSESSGIKISGYASVFNSEATISNFREKVLPGSFSDAVRRDDVVLLINHAGLPLARTTSGTLKLEEDDHGLRIATELDPDDPDVRALVPKLKRGDLSKMSFAFTVEEQEWDRTKSIPVRSIKKARLRDVSIVTHPAYEATSVNLRAFCGHNTTKMRMELALLIARAAFPR